MRLFPLLLCVTLSALASEVRVSVLGTSDLHGNIYPWDYLSAQTSARGLAKLATLIAAERQTNPNTLLVDAGDTIQGSPMESLWQSYVRTGKLPAGVQFHGPALAVDPMMLAMNHLGYDAMAVGNHEFNFGLANLERARGAAKFPWLSANTKAPVGRMPFDAFTVREVGGVRVGFIGLTTPAIPNWEKPENYKGYEFTDPVAAARAAIAELRHKRGTDVIVAVIHSGLEGGAAGENVVRRVATEVEGIDAIIFGHTHQSVGEMRIGNVLLTQPRNWGMSLAKLDFVLESKEGGGWKIRSRSARLLPVTGETPADPAVLRLAAPYHELTERYLETPVTTSAASINAALSRVRDTAIIDAIHETQLHYGKADVSFASSFNPRAAIAQGPVTVRQLAALYVYDNELFTIEGNGRMVREALENAARYFRTCQPEKCGGDLINHEVIGYNFDTAQGVTYQIDLNRPAGQRIENLSYQGKPLEDDRKLRIALNNYRAGGSGGYTMFRGAPVVWRSYEDIRDLMIEYYSEHPLPVAADDNWKVTPEDAQATLELSARRASGQQLTR